MVVTGNSLSPALFRVASATRRRSCSLSPNKRIAIPAMPGTKVARRINERCSIADRKQSGHWRGFVSTKAVERYGQPGTLRTRIQEGNGRANILTDNATHHCFGVSAERSHVARGSYETKIT